MNAPGRKLTEEQKQSAEKHLQIAEGFIQIASILLGPSAKENELRTGFSRLYYAFYHAALGFLISDGWVGHPPGHGRLPEELDKRLKAGNLGRMLRSLYELRRCSDYDTPSFFERFNRDIDEARRNAVLELRGSRTNFNRMYYEARKALTE